MVRKGNENLDIVSISAGTRCKKANRPRLSSMDSRMLHASNLYEVVWDVLSKSNDSPKW